VIKILYVPCVVVCLKTIFVGTAGDGIPTEHDRGEDTHIGLGIENTSAVPIIIGPIIKRFGSSVRPYMRCCQKCQTV
jgi:hypothetical protein